MNLSRRGFLGTMIAASVGMAAGFDPLKGLWVPGHAEPQAVDLVTPVDLVGAGSAWTSDLTAEQLELRDLAARFAKLVSPRVLNHKALLIRDVTFADLSKSPNGAIRLDDGRRGFFKPAHRRIAKSLQRGDVERELTAAADDTARDFRRDFDAIVPIGTELRAGVAFADCLVETGADLESGVSARALRFTTPTGVQTMFELAVGDWHPASRAGERRYSRFREARS